MDDLIYLFSDEDSIDIWSTDIGNPYHKLSNLIIREFVFLDGRTYKSVEHCYQVWKSGKFDESLHKQYRDITKPVKISGKVGLGITEEMLVRLMMVIIIISLDQNRDVLELLLETHPKRLTHKRENSKWKDLFPMILMNIREGVLKGKYIKGYEDGKDN